ncbi:hypothetical protein EB235_31400 [Mesorhizobium loti R88b]|uniref:Uncharacterized protein n=1 Tax=Mesorhizobium loti R88b TaxID=935548 RepID=A0A6M7WTP6_RHILI|nr:hypothetical protein EB235_31400 [Mesorhizobium loti R88b]
MIAIADRSEWPGNLPDQRGTDNARRHRKMAGRETGPAKKKVRTFRGEHRSVEWEETAKRSF